MDPSNNPAPPPDPTVSRVKRPVDAHRDPLTSETQGDSLGAGLGSTMLGGKDVVVIWFADPETPTVSRVVRPRVSSTGSSAETRSDSLPPLSAPGQKEMTEAEKAEAIASHMGYLESISDLRHLGSPGVNNWRHLLSGEIEEVSSTLNVHADGKKAIAMAGAKFDTKAVSFGGAIDTGHDTREYERSNPANRFKFYNSFSDSARATEYIAEVVRLASDRRVTLSLKSFDHDYDGMNIYTNHFQEMLEIVQEVYPKFVDTFGDTEHFLQGPVDGVNPKHIGWVQEASVSPRSHSGRMEIIGSVLDEKGFSTESYTEGCKLAGVKPETPWLYDDTMVTTVQDLVDQKYADIESPTRR